MDRKTAVGRATASTEWVVKPKCKRTNKRGYVIKYGSKETMVEDGHEAHRIYKQIQGSKSLSVCDGGYIIPLLSEP